MDKVAEGKIKLSEIVVKIWDMAQANMEQGNPPVVRQATLEWALEELSKLGYRKLPKDKPLLLGEEGADMSLPITAGQKPIIYYMKAQRVADIKFYEGK